MAGGFGAGDVADGEIEDQDDGDEDDHAGPGFVDPFGFGAGGVLENLEGERGEAIVEGDVDPGEGGVAGDDGLVVA